MIHRQRRSAVGARGQTREYLARLSELVPVLRAELEAPPRPHGVPALVVLMGVPGVGKSHCARLLAARLGAAWISSDQLRSRLFIAASYSAEESLTVFRAADALQEVLLRDGHRVILDATNLLARNREAATAAARRMGVPVVYVRVVADERDVLERLAGRRSARATGDHSEADESIYRRMNVFEPPSGGHLELRNGPDLAGELDRIVMEVERACSPVS